MNKVVNFICFLLVVVLTSCHDEFLEKKRMKADVTPRTLEDYEALLDNPLIMNSTTSSHIGLIGSDDYFLLEEIWKNLPVQHDKDAYVWSDNIFAVSQSIDWNHGYKKILYSNIVLEGLDKIGRTDENGEHWDQIRGRALFFRGETLYQLAQLFCKPYQKNTATQELGLPLRTESDINVSYGRSSLEETYRFIINDIEKAQALLLEYPVYNYRPSGLAARAFLARMYLQMGEYDLALVNADACLDLRSDLIDYNTLDPDEYFSFPLIMQDNIEVIFASSMDRLGILSIPRFNVDTVLYDLYDENDLRKVLYFMENGDYMTVKPGYAGFQSFTGLAVDEIYLIKAECLARRGDVATAIQILNKLLINRYKTGSELPDKLESEEAAMNAILTERRKELFYRGSLRWQELRRLSMDNRYARDITRKIGNQVFTLKPDDPKYTWLIPDDVIRTGNIKQNER